MGSELSFRSIINQLQLMSSSKAFFMVFIQVLLLPLLCFQSSKFVLGDDNNIHRLCKAAAVPETCIKCLEFDPRSKQTYHVKDYLNILFDCMNIHTGVLQNDMSALAFNTSDATTKEVYTDCVDLFTCSKSDLFAASLGLKSNDLSTVAYALDTALMYHDSCRNDVLRIEPFKDGLPVEITKELTAYKQLHDAASKMLEQVIA